MSPGLADDNNRTPRRNPASAFTSASIDDDTTAKDTRGQRSEALSGDRYETSHISSEKTRFSVDVDLELGEELRDAVVYAQYQGHPHITQAALLRRGIALVLDELREELDVDEFPPRGERSPRPGRPPS